MLKQLDPKRNRKASTTVYISRVCKCQAGRKTYKGFRWKYIETKK